MSTFSAISQREVPIPEIRQMLQDYVDASNYFTTLRDGSLEELDTSPEALQDYPILYWQVTGADCDNHVTTFGYDLIVADIMYESEREFLQYKQQHCFAGMHEVLGYLNNSNIKGCANQEASNSNDGRAQLITPVRCTPFAYRFDNLLVGWEAQIQLMTPQPMHGLNYML